MNIIEYALVPEEFFQYTECTILTVKKIIDHVKTQGNQAITEYTERFDGVTLQKFRVDSTDIKNAYRTVDDRVITTLKSVKNTITKFAEKQVSYYHDFEIEVEPGVYTGQKVIPIKRAGIYVPGGRYPLVSTVLMCAIPAVVAGVQEVVMCSPPSCQGDIHPEIVVASDIAGINEVYKIGGAQAIAAMAYGTETVKKVDKIVGPGNKYVTAAKKEVFGQVGIDFIAGPTEIMIIADDTASPEIVAADLLAQAEHDIHAVPVLVTTSVQVAQSVKKAVTTQLNTLKTCKIARKSLENGYIILVDRIDEAVECANRKAPEHVELQVAHPEKYCSKLRNYGSLFVGTFAAEALGDYSSGLNHTLPTNTAARYTGGLNVKDFLKFTTTLRVTKKGFNTIGPSAETMACIEGLAGHKKSIAMRNVFAKD